MIINDHDIKNIDDVKELLVDSGIDEMDADGILSIVCDSCQKEIDETTKGKEGFLNDDYYEMENAVQDCLQELDDCAEHLDMPSRKGYTRSDIANRLRTIKSNIDTYVENICIY